MEKACLPQRIFYSLRDIEDLWSVSDSEIWQWLMHGQLHAQVWLPLMSVYQIVEEKIGEHTIVSRRLKHFEGYGSVSAYHCRSLFRRGYTDLREFTDPDSRCKYALPEAADSPAITIDELVIVDRERDRFETMHRSLSQMARSSANVSSGRAQGADPDETNSCDPHFRNVRYNGRDYRFGEIQASILRQLYEAAREGDPWQNGKRLLADAGSQSFSVGNVFKRHPAWEEIIISNRRGAYGLSDNFIASVPHEKMTKS